MISDENIHESYQYLSPASHDAHIYIYTHILVGQQDDEIELRKGWSNAYATVISGDAQTLFRSKEVQQFPTKWEKHEQECPLFRTGKVERGVSRAKKVCLLGGDNPL